MEGTLDRGSRPWRKEIRVMSEEQLRIEIGHLRDDLGEVKATLREVRDRVLSTHVCPKPGACLELEAWGRDHEKRLRQLERREAMVVGACIILNLLAVAAMKML